MNYQELFQCLKGVGKLNLSGISLPVLGTKYVLYPVCCNPDHIDDAVIEMLTAARNANVNSFLTFFTATAERTRQWLIDSVANDASRILFALKNIESGSLYGYMGLAYGDAAGTRIEGDAIVRHSQQAEPGLMHAAFMQLVEWVRKDLGIKDIWIRVLSDNPALRFYHKCNFVSLSDAPLYEVKNLYGDIELLTECPDGNSGLSARTLTYMKYLPSE